MQRTTESQVEQAARRTAERRAAYTPEQRAAVAAAQAMVPEMLARMFVGPANSKGRQPMWVMPREEWVALGAPATAEAWLAWEAQGS
jgi:G:T/U-mismatch repair DNA glycosylase